MFTRYLALVGLVVACGSPVLAEEPGSSAGHGHMSLSFQVIRIDGFEGSAGKIPIGTVDTQSLTFDIDYNLTDRLTISAGLPYVRKRYDGPGVHDPLLLDPPRPEIENVDIKSWNNDFQDFHLGLRYLLRDGPVIIEPYVYFGVPSSNYPFFGHAAVGQNLNKLDVGSSFLWIPGLSDAYYRLDLGYVFVEETLDTSINHWLVTAEAGYFFSERLTGRLFAQLKKGSGMTFPDDFPPPLTDELWYQHDRLVKHNYLNVGVGLDWSLGGDYSLNTSVLTMAWAEQVHIVEYAVIIGLGRSF